MLPPPSIPGSEKSDGKKSKKEETPQVDAMVLDPYTLSPAHQKKAQQLAGTYAGLGTLLLGISPDTGKIIIMCAEQRAHEALCVARHHPEMMKAIDRIINGGDYVPFVFGHVSMLMAIFALRGLLPDIPIVQGYKMQGAMAIHQYDAMVNNGSNNGVHTTAQSNGIPS